MISPLLQSTALHQSRPVAVADTSFSVVKSGGSYSVKKGSLWLDFDGDQLWMYAGDSELVAHCADTAELPFDLSSGYQPDRPAHAIVSNWNELVEVMYNRYKLD